MSRPASPIAFEPVAQAVATAVLGPLRWKRIETLPLAALAISRGTVNGLTAADAALVEDLVLLFDRFDAADAAADEHAAAVAVFLGEVDARVLDRVHRGGHAELAEAVEPLGFRRSPVSLSYSSPYFSDVEVGALPAEADGVFADVPAGDRSDAALARHRACPRARRPSRPAR